METMNSSFLKILLSIHQVIYYHLNQRGMSKADMTTIWLPDWDKQLIALLLKDNKKVVSY